MEVVVTEEKKKIFRARKTMKISDRQQLESLHNTSLTATPGLSERSSPPLMNGTHKEDGPKVEDKEQNNVSDSNSPPAASPASPTSLSSPAPFLSLNLSPSPASSQSPTSKDDAPSTPTSPFHSLNFELKKMEEEGEEKTGSSEESVAVASTASKEKDKDVVPETEKKEKEKTTTDNPAVDSAKGSVKGLDTSSSEPTPVSGCTEPMDTDNDTTKTNDSETSKIKEEKPSSPKPTTSDPSPPCPSSSPPASFSVNPKQEKDFKCEDPKEEEDEKEDKKKGSTKEEKMEVGSVKVEFKKEKMGVSQTTKPSRPSSTPPSNTVQEEKGSTSGLKRTLSEGYEKDGQAVKREGKRPKVEREELEAELELKITANAGGHDKLEKIVQQLVDERLRVLELTIFDQHFKELKDRVDKVDCATKHQTAINTLQAKIARLAKKFGEANQASENKRKNEALAAAAAAANAAKTVTVATSAQAQRPIRTSMEVKQAQTVSSSSTAEEALAKILQMSDGESDGGEISNFSDVDWSEEEECSDSDPEPLQQKQNKKPIAPAVGMSTPVPSQCEQGRDGTIWKAIKPEKHMKRQIALSEVVGPTVHAKSNIENAVRAFSCLLDRKILQHIRDCTVAEAHHVEKDSSWDLSIPELKAFIALLYVRGVYNKNMELESFWSEEWGLAFFRTTMPRDRFRTIMRYLRFDNKHNRRVRLCVDKFALMSDVWDGFVKNSIACYRPGLCINVDEQLFPTKTRCRFTQYMANKPEKFGIKFWVAADTETKYFLNGFPYLGKDDMGTEHKHLRESVVMKLVEPYQGKGRNVTMNKCFTSLTLAKNLQNKNTSLIGPINTTRRELPPSIQQQRGELFSTKVLKHEQATLTVYQGTPKESIVLLSTMHPNVSIGTDKKGKPETVAFYNNTKAGVDILDQMTRLYSVRTATRRWPVAVFYNLLDLAAVNAHVLFKACTSTPIPRRAFILMLAKELREEQMCIKASLHSIPMEPQLPQEAGIRKQCKINSFCKQNKTLVSCTECLRHMCGKCTMRVERFCYKCFPLIPQRCVKS
ncbi:activating transcription factor 7-interacting protein 1 isoform X2 [Notolabrus celidotus]|uniref:activating transcription factor 7-interacting protein 1 isoform X2 n=1 Tax=Notolabrus celidotus TaxID=1203425 RepID=UPI0014906AD2|nr:activating transcription factor 7-interacting protein 1 isoform X2 [Notolabrus celidotus]